MSLFKTNSIHFTDARDIPLAGFAAATSVEITDSGDIQRDSTTVAHFTEWTRRGAQDTTDWTSDTYKTIVNLSGRGLFASYLGCTAGGSETHTVEITVDGGPARTFAITGMASGDRAFVACAPFLVVDPSSEEQSGAEALDSGKNINTGVVSVSATMMPWSTVIGRAIPLLRFNSSLLVRAKHSANITNATATSYSAVMYRKYLGA